MLPKMLQLNGSPSGLLLFLRVPKECRERLLNLQCRKQKGNMEVYMVNTEGWRMYTNTIEGKSACWSSQQYNVRII